MTDLEYAVPLKSHPILSMITSLVRGVASAILISPPAVARIPAVMVRFSRDSYSKLQNMFCKEEYEEIIPQSYLFLCPLMHRKKILSPPVDETGIVFEFT